MSAMMFQERWGAEVAGVAGPSAVRVWRSGERWANLNSWCSLLAIYQSVRTLIQKRLHAKHYYWNTFCFHINQVEYFCILFVFNTSYICSILHPLKLFKIHYLFIRTDDMSEDFHLVISKPKPTNMNLYLVEWLGHSTNYITFKNYSKAYTGRKTYVSNNISTIKSRSGTITVRPILYKGAQSKCWWLVFLESTYMPYSTRYIPQT